MKPFPLTFLRVTSRRPQYIAITMAVGFSMVVLSLPVMLLFGIILAHALHVPMDKPIREVPNGWLFSCLFMAGIPLSLVVGYLTSFVLLARTLRWQYGWTLARIRRLMFASEMPPYWLDAPRA